MSPNRALDPSNGSEVVSTISDVSSLTEEAPETAPGRHTSFATAVASRLI